MPFLHASVRTADESPELIDHLQVELLRLATGLLGKAASVTSVLVERVPGGAWRVGGNPVEPAAHVTISITEHTNTPQEKADFVARTHAMLREALGAKLPEATYVVVDEIHPDSSGYDGLTVTERRRI